MIDAFTYEKIFIPQWFERISIAYAKMTKKEREKEFMHIINEIYDYMNYKDYYNMKKELEELCKKENCNLDDFHYGDYPDEIEW